MTMAAETAETSAVPDDDFRVRKVAAPLRHSVTETIRAAIAVGRFRAGERLPERQVCELLGVSRTLVREALRQLESEGLIKAVPHRGPVVAKVTAEQAEGIYPVRAELEGLASQLFAEKAGAAHRAALLDAFEALKRSYASDDGIVLLNAKNRFYQRLVEGTANEALGITLQMLNSRVMVLRATTLKAPGRAKASLAELSQLVEALLAGDGQAARQAAERHVRNAAATAISLLKAAQDTTTD